MGLVSVFPNEMINPVCREREKVDESTGTELWKCRRPWARDLRNITINPDHKFQVYI